MIYNVATIWITLGTLVYLWHNAYMWDVASKSFRSEMVKFEFFCFTVLFFPYIAYNVMLVIVTVEVEFRRWKKEQGFD